MISNCILARTGPDCPGFAALAGLASPADSLEAIARQALRDSRWSTGNDLAFVLRRNGDEAVLAAFGAFDPADLERIRNLTAQLRRVAKKARYVDYRRAEQDCEVLAGELRATYGRQEVRKLAYVPVPRGGTIVLGILSYVLDLPSQSPDPGTYGDRPVVVVDDCILSGLRLGQVLPRIPGNRILCAALYAHPDLRRALVQTEPRVEACLSAGDLSDLAPDLEGEQYAKWKEKWARRLEGRARWIGNPEYLAFSWSEPESAFWNAATESIEAGWRLVPPERCLRNRSAGCGSADAGPRLQVPAPPKGPLRPAARALYARLGEDRIAAALPPDPDCYVLEEVAAAMWEALLRFGDIPAAAASLAGRYDVEPGRLERDLEGFAGDLLNRGLLVRNT